MASVYALTDPDTGLVRYVGATTTEVGRRIGRLRSSATRRGDRYPVCAWLRELGDRRPDHVVLEMCHRLDLATAERFWIEFMRSQGLADLNVLAGGNGVQR